MKQSLNLVSIVGPDKRMQDLQCALRLGLPFALAFFLHLCLHCHHLLHPLRHLRRLRPGCIWRPNMQQCATLVELPMKMNADILLQNELLL